MIEKKQQLLCTFTSATNLALTLDYIKTYYKVSKDKFFLYREGTPSANLSCLVIYNIEENLRTGGLAKNTILIHRKKHFNSFYTINGLNTLIQTINNGVLDKTYQVDWSLYTDKLITSADNQLRIIDIFFEKIIYG